MLSNSELLSNDKDSLSDAAQLCKMSQDV